jgi:hypothetical protein
MARQNGPVPGPGRSVLCGLRVARPGGRAGHGPLPRPAAHSRPGPLARAARERLGLLTPLYKRVARPSNPNPLPHHSSSPARPRCTPLTLISSLPIPPPPLPLGWSGSDVLAGVADVLAVGAAVVAVGANVLRGLLSSPPDPDLLSSRR